MCRISGNTASLLTVRNESIPVQALRVPGVCQISRQSAHECRKVVSPTHRPTLPLRIYSWYIFRSPAGRIVNEKFL